MPERKFKQKRILHNLGNRTFLGFYTYLHTITHVPTVVFNHHSIIKIEIASAIVRICFLRQDVSTHFSFTVWTWFCKLGEGERDSLANRTFITLFLNSLQFSTTEFNICYGELLMFALTSPQTRQLDGGNKLNKPEQNRGRDGITTGI